uniref:Phospholipid scramblase n=1 Tax=Timspurckia oligopyrenoides TaxID=708627 RepID=A0A7S1EU82_9RHOD|mmetsp:Transcript_7748/g.14065  ORF Transcript_7748/g.14065 Transcript_7748/m.14065 type:complete len:493 (+) Transcript_7748:77-1555(+)
MTSVHGIYRSLIQRSCIKHRLYAVNNSFCRVFTCRNSVHHSGRSQKWNHLSISSSATNFLGLKVQPPKYSANLKQNSSNPSIQPQDAPSLSSHLPSTPVHVQVSGDGGDSARKEMLRHPAIVVTREYEWGNILLGFEQANRYTMRAAPDGAIVGFIAEESSLGKSIVRNVLHTHRPFKATILSAQGVPVLNIRRPFYWISSSLFVETPNGDIIGEIHMNWHPWRRRYDLYIDKQQFASIDGGLLAWDFNLESETGSRIASINKDFTGLAREIFTDARQYVIRLDPSFGIESLPDGNDPSSTPVPLSASATQNATNSHPSAGQPAPLVAQNETPAATDVSDLTLAQRAVVLGCAVSIDFDYFSLHSGSGAIGPGIPFIMPIPGGGGGASEQPSTDGAGGAAAAGAAAAGSETYSQPSSTESEGFSSSKDTETSGDRWSTFEEPDHGFAKPPEDNNDGWGNFFGGDDDDGDDGDDDGGGGMMGSVFNGIFGSDD